MSVQSSTLAGQGSGVLVASMTVRSAASGLGTQGLGGWPHGEGRGGVHVQCSGAQMVPLQEASKHQEQLCPSQALPYAHSTPCRETKAQWALAMGPTCVGRGLGAQRAPAEKGRKAVRLTKRPCVSRKWLGLKRSGVAHCVLSRSTELNNGMTGVPCRTTPHQ